MVTKKELEEKIANLKNTCTERVGKLKEKHVIEMEELAKQKQDVIVNVKAGSIPEIFNKFSKDFRNVRIWIPNNQAVNVTDPSRIQNIEGNLVYVTDKGIYSVKHFSLTHPLKVSKKPRNEIVSKQLADINEEMAGLKKMHLKEMQDKDIIIDDLKKEMQMISKGTVGVDKILKDNKQLKKEIEAMKKKNRELEQVNKKLILKTKKLIELNEIVTNNENELDPEGE